VISVTKKRSIPWSNTSPVGWWIVSYIQRFEWKGSSPKTSRSRCLAWENTILIRARERESAHRKAIKFGKRSAGAKWERLGEPPGRLGRWIFEGITSLLPIYESLEDGSEVVWTEHPSISIRSLRRRVKSKLSLESFQD